MRFVEECLNVDPESPFPVGDVAWAQQSFPVSDTTHCAITIGGDQTIGGPSEIQEQGTTHDDHVTMLRDLETFVVSIAVYAAMNDTSPLHAHRADVLLQRVKARLWAPVASAGLSAAGLGVLSTPGIQDLTRFFRQSTWESVAELRVTMSRAEVIYEAPGTIDSIAGTGSLEPTLPEITIDAQE